MTFVFTVSGDSELVEAVRNELVRRGVEVLEKGGEVEVLVNKDTVLFKGKLGEERIDMKDLTSSSLAEYAMRFYTKGYALLLRKVLSEMESLAIVLHNYPDPDAMASGWALKLLAERFGAKAEVYYGGEIGRASNVAFMRRLGVPVKKVESVPDSYNRYALVDCAFPGENNLLQKGEVDIIIDHHATGRSAKARKFTYVKERVGSCSTIMTHFYQHLDVAPKVKLATALFIGIKTDTVNFTRGISSEDIKAAWYLAPHVYQPLVDVIESPPFQTSVMNAIGNAITSRRRRGRISISYAGDIEAPWVLSQCAEYLFREEGVETCVVLGNVNNALYMSARNRNKDIHLGDWLREILSDIGTAGGHATSAGARLDVPGERYNEVLERILQMYPEER